MHVDILKELQTRRKEFRLVMTSYLYLFVSAN